MTTPHRPTLDQLAAMHAGTALHAAWAAWLADPACMEWLR